MRILIILLIFILYGGANYYVAVRIFRMLKFFRNTVSVPLFAVVFIVISSTVLLSIMGSKAGLSRIISALGSVWIGVLMYLLIFTILADVLLLILKLTGHSSAPRMAIVEAAVLVLTFATVIGGFIHSRNIQIARYSVDTDKGSKSFRTVLVSDIHIGALGIEERLPEMVEMINSENPDVVCIAGDIFNNNISSIHNPEAVAEALSSIKSEYGVYACLGNHDCGNGFEDMLKLISDSGVTLLYEDYAVIPELCVIYGRADSSPVSTTGSVKRHDFDYNVISDFADLPVIVLDHNPANLGEYTSDISLILSGHTHKGQMFPGSLVTGAMYDVDYGMLRKSEDATTAIVTSGVGYWGPPIRVGTDSEIAVIEINK